MEKTSKAIQFLLDDHKIIRGLIRQVQSLDARAGEMHDGVLRELFMLLEIHSQIEQESFYPVLSQIDQADVQSWVSEYQGEHQECVQEIKELRSLASHSAEFKDRFGAMVESFEAHLDREEMDLFRTLSGLDIAWLDALEPELAQKKIELMKQPEYATALPREVQNPKGGEQKRRSA